ncbi:hypothetical protein [Nocardioides dongkuii]|uniref:hypothetical protein n=1 Tax=Nocardioides dongkuii TaxID=2760089 RepID=UPI0015F84DDE|nr:hypothetical protein [Nocardioides dongkuii]
MSHEEPTDVRDSTPGSTGPDRAAGGMGVSSERVGHAGPGQEATDGIRDVRTAPDSDDAGPDEEAAPEQARGGVETNPVDPGSKAGYPSKNPRSAEKPYDAPPDV